MSDDPYDSIEFLAARVRELETMVQELALLIERLMMENPKP